MKEKIAGDQSGFASLVIALVLILVLSLTTIGFAQLMRNEQRSALDKQLTNQAYYAAESGINDAAKAINSGYSIEKTGCEPFSNSNLPAGIDDTSKTAALTHLAKSEVGSGTGASYTCLLINPFPDDLQYTINTAEPRATQITGVNPSNTAENLLISSLIIGWEDASPNTKFAPNVSSNHRFETATDWPYTGMLKVGLTPLTSAGINRDKLINDTYTAFLYPNTGSAGNPPSYSYGSGVGKDGGVILNGSCHTNNRSQSGKRYCAVTISGLASSNYLLTMSPIYQNLNVTIIARGEGGTALKIKNAQTVIDSTGKAQDVLRRVQARISTRNDYVPPSGTETIQSLCKQLRITPSDATSASESDCPSP